MKDNAKTKQFISDNMIWLILIILVIAVSILQPSFMTASNWLTLLSGESVKGIMAFGVMFCILSKGIDLTPGASAAMIGCIVASLVQVQDNANRLFGQGGFGPIPAFPAYLIGLVIGAVIGAGYGWLIAYTKIPAFIATLGAQLMCRAGAKIYTNRPVSKLTSGFRFLGNGKIGAFPVIIIVFIIMYIITAFLLTQTRWGASVYAVGGNDQAARVAGINVEKTLVLVYMWSGLCAALGGMLLAGRAGSSDPALTGLNYELDAIAAATVGGTSHTGGIARISGVLCGILVMGVINNGLVMLKVDDNMTNIVKGAIIIGSVILDMRKNAKRA
jgi:ribose/xylose/arabinose/galactoside ABC-type transport system permease subunit